MMPHYIDMVRSVARIMGLALAIAGAVVHVLALYSARHGPHRHRHAEASRVAQLSLVAFFFGVALLLWST